MKVLVTGSEGFIGSHFCDLLESEGVEVERCDVKLGVGIVGLNVHRLEGVDWVAHFAAEAVVNNDVIHHRALLDLWKLFALMEPAGCTKFLFASSSAALNPTTFYGASKAACEAFLRAWAAQGNTVLVGRWDLVFGERYARGHVRDFVERLQENPDRLELKGDGLRYGIYVGDLCEGLMADMVAADYFGDQYREWRFSSGLSFRVSESARWIAERMGLTPEIVVGGDCEPPRMPQGSYPGRMTVRESIERTVDWLCASTS